MHHRTLREIAKFGAGLVTADLLTLFWLYSNNLFPVQTWGVTWTGNIALPGIVFDFALLLLLVHYGWHLGKIPRPRERSYLMVAGVVFTVVALVHLVRVFTGADITLIGWSVPLWLSWIGTAAATYLAYASFYFALRSK